MKLNEPKVLREGIKYGRELLIFVFIGSVSFHIAMKRQCYCHSFILRFYVLTPLALGIKITINRQALHSFIRVTYQ